MCSAPIVRTAVRAATAVATFGTSEIARQIPVIGDVARLPENLAGGVAIGLGAPTGIKTPSPVAPTPTDTAGPMPTPGSPGLTDVASNSAARRRRLSALRRGALSTIATSGSGLAGSPSLSTPAAGGLSTGVKLKLGQ